jgi:solute:Na+ symporter, SSS family
VTLALALLILFCALMIAVGLWIGRRAGASDFFVAGRGLSPALLFSTVLAANIGAGTTVNATAIGYRHGLAAWWWDGSAALGTLALALWIGPRIWAEANRHGDLTTGDFLERHYGRPMRGAVALVIWIATLNVLAAQLLGMAAVLQIVGDVPRVAGAAAGAAVALIYFSAGGLLSTASVNRVQLIVILTGFAVAATLAVSAAGGWSALRQTAAIPVPEPGIWTYVFMLVPSFIVSPGLLQKTFGARDARTVRTGLLWAGVAMLLFACAPPLLGVSAHALHPGLPRDDLALPTVLSRSMPFAFGSFALAAVFSAEISTADAVLFMLSTSASHDLYKSFVNPRASDRAVLFVARLAAVAGAFAALLLAFWFTSILQALGAFYSVLAVVMFVPVVGALYVPRASRAAGLSAVIAGLVVLAVVQYVTANRGYGIVTPPLAGILASAVAFAATEVAAYVRGGRRAR